MFDDHNSVNDNSRPTSTNAHSSGALLLVESLVHGLCEKAVLSTAEAIEIVERAADVQYDFAKAAEGDSASLWRSHAQLSFIAASLRIDTKGGPAPYLIS